MFKFYVKPFTASPYYDFFDSFLLGLKLETFFKGSEACIMDVVYGIDDFFYLKNNISDFKWKSWEAPIMNLSKSLSGNWSSALVDCATMGTNAYSYAQTKYTQFGSNIGNFIMSFLFNLMGSALKFKSIFDEIQADIKNQNYADIANQYGRMIRIMLDFDPMETASMQKASENFEEFLETFSEEDLLILGQINDEDGFKTIDAIRNKIKHFKDILTLN